MRINNLYKAELYRFFHSIFIFIFMAVGLLGIMFLASDNSDVLLGDGTVEGALNSTMRVANLMIVLIVSVGISSYAGKEFRLKTICYEIMGGHPLWKISLTKTITCGLFVSVLLQLCILFFFIAVPGALQMYSPLHILFMFIIILHICSCTVLYVILCRNGALGGCLAFVRFTLLEVTVLFAMGLFAPESVCGKCKSLSVMSQWSAASYSGFAIPQEYMAGIILGALMEYAILLVAIQFCSKKVDF